MQHWFTRVRTWWRKWFFWQHTHEGSHEFKPETDHDHALVLSVLEPKRVPRWQQIRFLHRLLSPTERRIFWISLGCFFLAAGTGAWLFIQPHIVIVPATGGRVTEGLIGSPKLINPLFAPLHDVDRDLTSLLFSGLFRINAELNPEGDLAERYQWSDDQKTLNISLRKDVYFHDGQMLTAEDVIFTFNALKNPLWRSPLSGTFKNVKIIALDPQTIQFQLDRPDPTFLSNLTVGILPAHAWADVPDNGAQLTDLNSKPIGSGPYQADSLMRDTKGTIVSYQLKRFERYYGIKPAIEYWNFRFYPDRESATTAFENHQIDAMAFLPWAAAEELKATHTRLVRVELPQQTVAFFNTTHSILKDDRVRHALIDAIDEKELQDLVKDKAALVNQPFPFMDWRASTSASLESARELLESAGWRLKQNENVRSTTIPAPKGAPKGTTATTTELALTIEVPEQPDLQKIAEYLKRRWSLLGARISIDVLDGDRLSAQAVNDHTTYQILVTNVLLSSTQDIKPFWSSFNATAGKLNFSNLQDRDIDTALTNIDNATSTPALEAARQKAADVISSHHAAAFLLRPGYAYAVTNEIMGVHHIRASRPSERLLRAAEQWYLHTDWKWR